VVAGPPVSVANLLIPIRGHVQPKPIPDAERRELIKRAREIEYAARWPTHGLKPNGGHR